MTATIYPNMTPCPQCKHPVNSHYVWEELGYGCWDERVAGARENGNFCRCKHGEPEAPSAIMYVIRYGKVYFRKPSRRRGLWVSALQEATFFERLPKARLRMTMLSKAGYPIADLQLVELKATESQVLDEATRLADVAHKKQVAEDKRRQAHVERELRDAEAALRRAQAKVKQLKGAQT